MKCNETVVWGLDRKIIVHFTVVRLVTWPLGGNEAGVDPALIQTLLPFLCKCRVVSMRTT